MINISKLAAMSSLLLFGDITNAIKMGSHPDEMEKTFSKYYNVQGDVAGCNYEIAGCRHILDDYLDYFNDEADICVPDEAHKRELIPHIQCRNKHEYKQLLLDDGLYDNIKGVYEWELDEITNIDIENANDKYGNNWDHKAEKVYIVDVKYENKFTERQGNKLCKVHACGTEEYEIYNDEIMKYQVLDTYIKDIDCDESPSGYSTDIKEAIVMLNVGQPHIDGYVKFEDNGDNTIKISAKITGLSPNKDHGWHIHQYGDIFTDGCTSTGPHYNPFKKTHGGPDDHIRHIGDLGNIHADEYGVAYIESQYDDIIKLNGPNSIIGRGFVIHEDKDDLGKTDHPLSSTTGNAGDRIACGVIGIMREE